MWIGGTLLRLPIAVKSTDINIHGLSIHLHQPLRAAGIKSSNFGILAPHDRRRRRERGVLLQKRLNQFVAPHPPTLLLSASDDDF